jgi:hypothetical protein
MRTCIRLVAAALCPLAPIASLAATDAGFTTGTPEIRSLSALAFGPEGILFIGDGKGGAVVAVDLDDRKAAPTKVEPLVLTDVEGSLAALLGTTADDVMVHDLAVNPLSRNVYLAVSRGRSGWESSWQLPNEIADANVLLRIAPGGGISEVPLSEVRFTSTRLPNPVDSEKEHPWKSGVRLRADTITDMAYTDGTLFVAGLSNEEFASTLWRIPYPFAEGTTATTLEIFHAAHGEYETHAPIRTFVPYELGGQAQILAAYLCTPFVTFPLSELADGAHVKGRTVGEFGSGNYPVDMIAYEKDGKPRLLIANTNLPYMIVDPAAIEAFEGALTEEPPTYVAGVAYEVRSGVGVQQLDAYGNEAFLALRRLPNGRLALETVPVGRF